MTWARPCPASLSPQGGMERGEMATLPHHTVRPSRGLQAAVSRARCLLAAGSAGKGRAHKENTEVPRFHFSHKRLLFCSYVLRREKSLRRASFLSLLSPICRCKPEV